MSKNRKASQRRTVPSLTEQRSHELAKVIHRQRNQNADAPPEYLSAATVEGYACFIRMALKTAAECSIYAVPRVCGVVPWSARFRWRCWAYQVSVLVLGLSCCCWFLVQLVMSLATEAEMLSQPYQCIDLVVALSGLLPLFAFGGLWQSRAVSTNVEVLAEYAEQEGFLSQCRSLDFQDILCTFSLWSLTVCARAWESGNGPASRLSLFAFIFASGLTAGVTTQLLSLCRSLAKMIDTFCYNVVEQPDFDVAKQEWHLLHALCRTSCGSVQWPFAALQVTGTLVSLFIMAELRHGLARARMLLPGVLVCASILRVGFWAAAVTDKCARVPMLVNAIEVQGAEARERMFVVEYITHSRAGFYIFEVCLSTATILKALYVSGAVTFALVSEW